MALIGGEGQAEATRRLAKRKQMSPSPIELAEEPAPNLVKGEVLFVGTATVLMRCAGFTILTDPNFLHAGEYARLGYGLRSKRLTEPAMGIDELPPLDFIVLSHHHGDHFDDRAARELDKDLPIITTPHAARKLRRQGFRGPLPLETGEAQDVVRGLARVRVTAVPAEHAPRPLGRLLPPVMGSIIDVEWEGRRLLRTYITADTLVHDRLEEIARLHPGIDLCLIHLGGTKVLGILLTMDARQGVEALRIVRPRVAIPIHYNDYTVFRSPLKDFKRAASSIGLQTDLHYLSHGETYRFPLAPDP